NVFSSLKFVDAIRVRELEPALILSSPVGANTDEVLAFDEKYDEDFVAAAFSGSLFYGGHIGRGKSNLVVAFGCSDEIHASEVSLRSASGLKRHLDSGFSGTREDAPDFNNIARQALGSLGRVRFDDLLRTAHGLILPYRYQPAFLYGD